MTLLLYARDSNRAKLGQIGDWQSFVAVLRFNDVGRWTIDLEASTEGAAMLDKDCGLIAMYNDRALISGPVDTIKQTWKDSVDRYVVSGPCDNIYIKERTMLPSFLPYTYTVFDQYDDVCESAIKYYVAQSCTDGGWDARQAVPGLEIADDQGRGLPVTGAAQYDNLMTFINNLAVASNEMGWSLMQNSPDDPTLTFDVYEPADKTETVKFGRQYGNLTEYEIEEQRPTANFFLLAGLHRDQAAIDAAAAAKVGKQTAVDALSTAQQVRKDAVAAHKVALRTIVDGAKDARAAAEDIYDGQQVLIRALRADISANESASKQAARNLELAQEAAAKEAYNEAASLVKEARQDSKEAVALKVATDRAIAQASKVDNANIAEAEAAAKAIQDATDDVAFDKAQTALAVALRKDVSANGNAARAVAKALETAQRAQANADIAAGREAMAVARQDSKEAVALKVATDQAVVAASKIDRANATAALAAAGAIKRATDAGITAQERIDKANAAAAAADALLALKQAEAVKKQATADAQATSEALVDSQNSKDPSNIDVLELSDQDSIDTWGRIDAPIIDSKSTSDPDQQQQSLVTALTTDAERRAFALVVVDSDMARFGEDWWRGDRASVQINDVTFSNIIREVDATWADADTPSEIKPIIGTPLIAHPRIPRFFTGLRASTQRIYSLERKV